MKTRGLFIAALLLAGLSGALWWSNRQKAAEEAKPVTSTTSPKIVEIKQDNVTRIDVARKDTAPTVLEKSAQGWRITAPLRCTKLLFGAPRAVLGEYGARARSRGRSVT